MKNIIFKKIKNLVKIFFLLTLNIVLFSNYLFSQVTEIRFETVGSEQGLSQSSASCIVQDYRGFIWIGTLSGLNRYDGRKTLNYYFDSKDVNSISDNAINTLFEDSEKNLWVGTRLGLCKYNRTKNNFIRIVSEKNPISGSVITSIIEDNKGYLWIGTNLGLNRYDKKTNTFTAFKFNSSDTNTISNNYINQIVYNNRNYLWLATNKGLNRFDINTGKSIRYYFPEGNAYDRINTVYITKDESVYVGTNYSISELVYDKKTGKFNYFENFKLSNTTKSSTKVKKEFDFTAKSIVEDKQNVLWIGSQKNGLIMFNPKTKEFKTFRHDPTKYKSLSANHILTLYQDKTNILWIGTYLGGVNTWNRVTDNFAIYRHNPYERNGLSSSQIRSIYQGRQGDIWIGTVDGGLNKWNRDEDKFTHFKNAIFDNKSLPNNHVRTMLDDSEGNFWVGTHGGGLATLSGKNKFVRYTHNKNNTSTIGSNKIWKIYEDSRGNIWIGTYGGGLNLFIPETKTFKKFTHNSDDKKSISSNNITSILEDSKGQLWIGTDGGGLNYFNYKDSTFTFYKFEQNNSKSISDNRIYSIFEDSNENLWIGTKDGLNLYLSDKDEFEVFSTEDGFPNSVIMGILEDQDSNLWISTNKGLCKFNKDKGVIRNFDEKDGLQANEFLVGSYCKTRNGELFFGGINGLNSFFPRKIKENQNPPAIVITGFKMLNKNSKLDTTISEKKHLYLNWEDNAISFDFVALNYIFPDKNQYKIKMEGYIDEWIDIGSSTSYSFKNLPSNKKYVFRVIGSNNDGIWNEVGASVIIHISPRWWETILAKISGILIIVVLIVSWVKFREQQLKKEKRELEEIVSTRTSELRLKNKELAQKTEDILDSIKYASRIQNAILPSVKILNNALPDNFVLFKPRDIVSGDYYWITRQNEITVIAAADCTGHGVPGAFMSMLGIAFLNEIVSKQINFESNKILNELRRLVKTSLNQDGKQYEAQDGMDIALCVINHENNTLEYSGAFNSLIIIRDKQIVEVKADKMPIGLHYSDSEPFTKNKIEVKKNDTLYMYSDGYPDQFGGPKGKKFLSKRFKNFLLEINDQTLIEQKEILEKRLEDWRGELEQVDDILVMGFKIN